MAAKRRAARNPNFALQVVGCIYNRNQARERRRGQHLGHDGQGFRQEDLGGLVALYERLERERFRWHEGNLADKHRVMREAQRYASQYIKAQDEAYREREEHMAYTKAELQQEAAQEATSEQKEERKERQR